ncbi:MAG: class I SAM-dependent methyltransferase [Chloroflexi bacterium]|nr:class I SAM-dependent methyltransferase [Chloroflexota bacterium]
MTLSVSGASCEDVLHYYQSTEESERLQREENELELLRTREILMRFLPPAPADVLDVGGGPAVHSLWLAELGYRTHLVDLVPRHIQQARALERIAPARLAGCTVGDARRLGVPSGSKDAVLLLGPLYHLPEREDRMQALREAWRILRPGGTLIVQGISRYAALLKVLTRHLLDDLSMIYVAHHTTRSGQHRPGRRTDFFTNAYFHHPTDLRQELVQAGFEHRVTLGVEGPARLCGDEFARHWRDPFTREWLLDLARSLESEPHLLGVSGHLMAVAGKPGEGGG